MNLETEKLLQCQVCAREVGKHIALSGFSGHVESCLCLEGRTWNEAGVNGGVRNCTANAGECCTALLLCKFMLSHRSTACPSRSIR